MCMEGLATGSADDTGMHVLRCISSSKAITGCFVHVESAENCLVVRTHMTQAVNVASVAAYDVLRGLRSAYQQHHPTLCDPEHLG